MRDKNPGRAFPRGDLRFADADSPGGRFDIVSAGHGHCRIRVDRGSRRNRGGGRVHRRGGTGLCWRGGRTGLSRCDRGCRRKLFGGHLGSRILVVGGDGRRPCSRRRVGRRARLRRLHGRDRQLRNRRGHTKVWGRRHDLGRMLERQRSSCSLVGPGLVRRRSIAGRRDRRRSDLRCRWRAGAGVGRRHCRGCVHSRRRRDARHIARNPGCAAGIAAHRGSRRGRGTSSRGAGRFGGRSFCGRLRHRSRRSGLCSGRSLSRAGGDRHGRRNRHRVCGGSGRGRCRLRSDGGPRREEPQRVDVALRVGRDADAEVDVRLVELGRTARANAAHRRAFGDDDALQHADRAEMDDRDRVAVVGADRHRLAAAGHRPGEGDGSAGGGDDVSPGRVGDVDAAMLASPVRVAAERERLQHRTVCRPGPSACTRRPHERDQKSEQHQPAHSSHLRCCLN